jgi:hypothetical protein
MAPPPPMPELIPDAVAEILLRLPRDDPAGLVRASAVCKPWLRTLTDPAFLRRYRAFHGTSSVLGFLHNPTDRGLARFVPTTAFRPHAAAAAHRTRTCVVLDCRHGHALLYDYGSTEFVVWDPVTGRERRIPDEAPNIYTNHAVLCAAGARPPAAITAPAAGGRSYWPVWAWLCMKSMKTCTTLPTAASTRLRPARRAHRLTCTWRTSTTSAALRTVPPCSWLPPAANYFLGSSTIVMTASNGGLGLATFYDGILAMWSTETGPNGDAKWVLINLIHLGMLLPADIHMSSAWLSGFAEDANFIFLSTDDNGIFTIELNSLLTRKVCELGNVKHVFPYLSFYTPAGTASCASPSLFALLQL